MAKPTILRFCKEVENCSKAGTETSLEIWAKHKIHDTVARRENGKISDHFKISWASQDL